MDFAPILHAILAPLWWLLPLAASMGLLRLFAPRLRGAAGEAAVSRVLRRHCPARFARELPEAVLTLRTLPSQLRELNRAAPSPVLRAAFERVCAAAAYSPGRWARSLNLELVPHSAQALST